MFKNKGVWLNGGQNTEKLDGQIKLRTTQPKRNADLRAKSKGLCIFIKSLNLMDLALNKKKEKAKQ